MRRPRIGLRLPRTVTAIAAAALLAGCGLNLESVALPAPGGGGSFYTLNAVFSDALNLPTKAKVRLYGAQIGEVSEIRAQDFTAHIAMHVRSDVPLYEGSTAELRAATPLGDVFVQIRPDPNRGEDAELLRDGATLPLEATANAPTIEELLGSMALLVNGGTVRYLSRCSTVRATPWGDGAPRSPPSSSRPTRCCPG